MTKCGGFNRGTAPEVFPEVDPHTHTRSRENTINIVLPVNYYQQKLKTGHIY